MSNEPILTRAQVMRPSMSAANSDKELIAAGYRRTSNKYGLISRIDRPDWRDVIIATTHQTVETMRKATPGMWEDHYRRCHSKDQIELGAWRGKKIPTSNWDPVGFVEISISA